MCGKETATWQLLWVCETAFAENEFANYQLLASIAKGASAKLLRLKTSEKFQEWLQGKTADVRWALVTGRREAKPCIAISAELPPEEMPVFWAVVPSSQGQCERASAWLQSAREHGLGYPKYVVDALEKLTPIIVDAGCQLRWHEHPLEQDKARIALVLACLTAPGGDGDVGAGGGPAYPRARLCSQAEPLTPKVGKYDDSGYIQAATSSLCSSESFEDNASGFIQDAKSDLDSFESFEAAGLPQHDDGSGSLQDTKPNQWNVGPSEERQHDDLFTLASALQRSVLPAPVEEFVRLAFPSLKAEEIERSLLNVAPTCYED